MGGKAAIIGAGVIGGGWAARFQLAGWDVAVFDPDPKAPQRLAAMLDNAREALAGLSDAPLPAEGRLHFAQDMKTATQSSDYIQESVAERLDFKRRIIAEIQTVAAPGVPLGSSTSGLRPSQLQEGALRPADIFVAHPFNPVYLLPLVEVVATEKNDPQLIDHACETMKSLGMHPLRLRREIDAHIADRLLEAVWRAALWLVNDGIATTAEIDDAIRLGFGLRWAQMGLFETYRIAGGEAGMRHFLAQFGPCLNEPWTRLTEVPAYDEALVERIAGRSDAQSGAHSIGELERIRDANLVGILRVLKQNDWGAGQVLNAHERRRREPGGK